MKIRIGFVTNSSSSSFIVVGVHNEDVIEQMKKLEKEEIKCSYGCYHGDHFSFYGNWNDVYYAGLEASSLIEQDMKLSEIKNMFMFKCKELGIKVSANDVIFEYGEMGD